MRMFFIAVLFLGLFTGCNKKTKIYPDPGGGTAINWEARYTEVRPALDESCLTSGCHAGGAIVDLTTAAGLRGPNSRARIEGGTMPPPNSGAANDFESSGNKATILSYWD
jgi:hypothetical protein